MKRAALYLRVSTVDQHPKTQLYDLRQMAMQLGLEVVQEYRDRISGVRAKPPDLDQRGKKSRPLNPTKQSAGSPRSGRDKTCTFSY